ncbi:MAG: hypothetical protein HP492_00400 [Nitrospira sp.]|nr:hypothetical protein [Nitrospira sp.]
MKETGEAVIIGCQGNDQITADDIAKWTGTIAYEVLCTIGSRVPPVRQSSQPRSAGWSNPAATRRWNSR